MDKFLLSCIVLCYVGPVLSLFDSVADSVKYINTHQKYWRARENALRDFFPSFQDTEDPAISERRFDYERPSASKEETDSLPNISYFDARKNWVRCYSLKEVPKQGKCANSWAVAVAAGIADQLCIKSGGVGSTGLSAEDLTTCCPMCTSEILDPCRGGIVMRAIEFWLQRGIVSGSYYGAVGGCKPYSKKLLDYDTFIPMLNTYGNKDLACVRKCTNSYHDTEYKKDRVSGRSLNAEMRIFSKGAIKQIQQSILTYGPVIAPFHHEEEFYLYADGVYVPFNSKNSSWHWHTVNIIGWGTEEGVDYWLARSTWGSDWGLLGGCFKIRRGHNDGNIESFVYSVVFDAGRSRSYPLNKTVSFDYLASASVTISNSHFIISSLLIIVILH